MTRPLTALLLLGARCVHVGSSEAFASSFEVAHEAAAASKKSVDATTAAAARNTPAARQLEIARWYCGTGGNNNAAGNVASPPCEHLALVRKLAAAESAEERLALEQQQAALTGKGSPDWEDARALARLCAGYVAMRTAFCAAHGASSSGGDSNGNGDGGAGLACTDATLSKAYFSLASVHATNKTQHHAIKALDSMVYHQLLVEHKRADATEEHAKVGHLTMQKCDAFVRDSAHLFRGMWAAQGWAPMSDDTPKCWDVASTVGAAGAASSTAASKIDPETFFADAWSGAKCGTTNWYDGHGADVLSLNARGLPHFASGRASPLLGFDSSVYKQCTNEMEKRAYGDRRQGKLRCFVAAFPAQRAAHCYADAASPETDCDWEALAGQVARRDAQHLHKHNFTCNHVQRCMLAEANILSLVRGFNSCRALEWLVCAARGTLPGQGGPPGTLKFAIPPSKLDTTGAEGKPLGKCSGWRPRRPPATDGRPAPIGYTNDDVAFLNVCLVSFICSNGDQIFKLKSAASPFTCELSGSKWQELVTLLRTPPTAPTPYVCH